MTLEEKKLILDAAYIINYLVEAYDVDDYDGRIDKWWEDYSRIITNGENSITESTGNEYGYKGVF